MNQVNRNLARRTPPALAVGDRVSGLVFEHGRGKRLALRSLRGRPFLLVVSSASRGGGALTGWGPLHGLRASLVVLSARGAWLRESDDPARYVTLLDGTEGGPAPVLVADPPDHTLTFLVIDVTGTVREVAVEPAGTHDAFSGLDALRPTLDALCADPTGAPPVIGHRETVLARMISTLAMLALEEPPPADRQVPSQSGTFRVPDAEELLALAAGE